jgi:predicted nucleic acid-binding protein
MLIRSELAHRQTLAGPDAVIAATALMANATLVTTNPRHFSIRGVTVQAVDERGAAI